MLANSRDPIPPVSTYPNDIVVNFKVGRDHATLIYPAIVHFAERPTLKSAKSMLKAYNIHFPLATLLAKNKPPRRIKKDETVAKGGVGVNKTPIIHELLVLDTMHDLLHHNSRLVYDVFKKEIDMPVALKQAFLKSQYAFSRDASRYILQRANIALTSTSYYPIQPEIQQKTLQKEYNVKLKNAISKWTNMKFVLDNFVASLDSNGDESKGTYALIGCAYLIVLLANMKRLELLKGNTIVFLDGFFMTMDGNYMKRFLTLFTRTIHRLTNMHTSVVAYKEKTLLTKPKHFNELFQGANVSIDEKHVVFKNKKYEITQAKTESSSIIFPHSKEKFYEYFKANPTNKDLWHLNFLRDAFKADIAVETHSIYMTHDRLAHTYYKFIGGTQGFLLSHEETLRENTIHCDYCVSF